MTGCSGLVPKTENVCCQEWHGVGTRLNQGHHALIVLQHHILVQEPLSMVQQLPPILGEVHQCIIEKHGSL